MLAVLTIFLVLITVSSSALPRYMEKREMEHFLQQFSRDYHYAQSYAINHQAMIAFIVDINRQQYLAMEGYNRTLFKKDIPKNIRFDYGSLNGRIYFNNMGHVTDSGHWIFRSQNKIYFFTVHLGRGRHYYAEV